MTEDAMVLLARLSQEQEYITRERHALARKAALIQECQTRLRTGQAAGIVEAYLTEAVSVRT